MADARATVTNLLTSFDTLDALIEPLTQEQWDTPSYCPDWTVGGVVAHLAGIEKIMTGWMPADATDLPPFGDVGAYAAEVADLSGPDRLASWRTVIGARRAELEAITDEALASPSGSPVGPMTYGGFLSVRVFDFWIHEQDIRGPLGLPGNDSGPVAAEAMQQTLNSLPYIVGKKIGLEEGMSIRIVTTGGVETERSLVVDGRAGFVDSIGDPTIILTADSTVFQMLACGRIDPQGPIDAGTIAWSGDAEWGEKAARSLRYTM